MTGWPIRSDVLHVAWIIETARVAIVVLAFTFVATVVFGGAGTPKSVGLSAGASAPVASVLLIVWSIVLLGTVWCQRVRWRNMYAAVAAALCVGNAVVGPIAYSDRFSLFVVPLWFGFAALVILAALIERPRIRR